MTLSKMNKKTTRLNKKFERMKLFLYILPFMILLFIFSYYPLYGWIYAFFDYRPPLALKDCDFVGLQWFKSMVDSPVKVQQLLGILRNTFVMSGLGILTSWLPMVFAIFLAECRSSKFQKIVQTFTTTPNFISWVLVYFMAYSIFSSSGAMNNILMNLGLITEPIQFLEQESGTWLSMWAWNTWKGLGWSAIMYLAALGGIDQGLYEAARVDGAGRFKIIWHITIPGLLPTYFVLLLLSIANFLNNGMEQYFLFQNAFNSDHIQVLDLYVYNLAMKSGSYSLATAISILKTFVSVILLFSVNRFSKAVRGESIV